MDISLYDVVLMKNGLKAQVVEALGDGECYVLDVEEVDGWDEDDTILALSEEIAANLGTWQEAERFGYVIDSRF